MMWAFSLSSFCSLFFFFFGGGGSWLVVLFKTICLDSGYVLRGVAAYVGDG